MISVVVPVYGNKDTLVDLHAQLQAVLDADHEIVFVDDACPHGSGAVLREMAAHLSDVRVVTMKQNVGQNTAIIAGLAVAQGEIAVIMDADLQDPPEAIPLLIDELRAKHVDIVFATRRSDFHHNLLDNLSSGLFKGLLTLLSRGRIPLGAGLFLVMNAHARQLLANEGRRWPYIIGFIAHTQLRTMGLFVGRNKRLTGASAYTSIKRLQLAIRALLFSFSPLRLRWTPPDMTAYVYGENDAA